MPIYDQESLEPKEIHPGVKVRIMHGEKIMMMLVDIRITFSSFFSNTFKKVWNLSQKKEVQILG